ncbi:MAG: hypothetical protein JMJ93_07300 [Synergistaceae bacterium]|nr:hypothetical protein [Synergistaceae bacterium]
MKIAVVDLGSNSVRSLVVAVDKGQLRFVDATSTVTRLTEGIGEGPFSPRAEALERTVTVLSRLKDRLVGQEISPEGQVFFATESLRAAGTDEGLIAALEAASGLPLQILSGDEEARLSAEGVRLGGLDAEAVFDLGGGSLEVVGTRVLSLPLGAVRMAGRFSEDRLALSRHVDDVLRQSGLARVSLLAGVGGTSSTLAMMLGRLPRVHYHPRLLHRRGISRFQVQRMVFSLASMGGDERTGVVGLDPKRADIIVAGLTVIERLMTYFGVESYRHSECDLLWAMAAAKARELGRPATGVLF